MSEPQTVLETSDYGRIVKLGVYRWKPTNYPWWQFWKPSHVLEKIGTIPVERERDAS